MPLKCNPSLSSSNWRGNVCFQTSLIVALVLATIALTVAAKKGKILLSHKATVATYTVLIGLASLLVCNLLRISQKKSGRIPTPPESPRKEETWKPTLIAPSKTPEPVEGINSIDANSIPRVHERTKEYFYLKGQTDGHCFSVAANKISLNCLTVSQLKNILAKHLGYLPNQLTLIWAGKILSDEQTFVNILEKVLSPVLYFVIKKEKD